MLECVAPVVLIAAFVFRCINILRLFHLLCRNGNETLFGFDFVSDDAVITEGNVLMGWQFNAPPVSLDERFVIILPMPINAACAYVLKGLALPRASRSSEVALASSRRLSRLTSALAVAPVFSRSLLLQ